METLQYPIEEVAGKKEKTQQERLMEIDNWLNIIIPKLDAEKQAGSIYNPRDVKGYERENP